MLEMKVRHPPILCHPFGIHDCKFICTFASFNYLLSPAILLGINNISPKNLVVLNLLFNFAPQRRIECTYAIYHNVGIEGLDGEGVDSFVESHPLLTNSLTTEHVLFPFF